jgi:hypothetical protein
MTEVYKALKEIGCTWYAINNYRILCKWQAAAPRIVTSALQSTNNSFQYGRTSAIEIPNDSRVVTPLPNQVSRVKYINYYINISKFCALLGIFE